MKGPLFVVPMEHNTKAHLFETGFFRRLRRRIISLQLPPTGCRGVEAPQDSGCPHNVDAGTAYLHTGENCGR